uniref:Uncharacterized protein n=1 Tax=Schizaphis graminum TaxID=13262 RepID=A0A2S2PIH8_SCHGA
MRSVTTARPSRHRKTPVGVRFKSTHARVSTITCTQTNVYTRRTLLQTNTHRVHKPTVSVGVIAGAAATVAGPMFPFATCLAGSGIGRHPRCIITVPAQINCCRVNPQLRSCTLHLITPRYTSSPSHLNFSVRGAVEQPVYPSKVKGVITVYVFESGTLGVFSCISN